MLPQKTYKIRQYINGKLISFIKVKCSYEDYLALKSLMLLPSEDEIVDEYKYFKFYIYNTNTKEKVFFSFATSFDVNEKVLISSLLNRSYNDVFVEKVFILLISWEKAPNLIKKGRDYEDHVANFYEKKGYSVIRNYQKKYDDEGIDIIAKKGDEILLIQCKNWQVPLITQKDLKEFLGSCYLFLYKHKEYRKYRVRRLLITNSNEYSQSAKKLLDSYFPFIECVKIPLKN